MSQTPFGINRNQRSMRVVTTRRLGDYLAAFVKELIGVTTPDTGRKLDVRRPLTDYEEIHVRRAKRW